jgi:hypothetical protein
MTTLQSLSSPFRFSVEEALKSGFSITGTTGCGKTDTAFKCADALRNAGATLFIFDPSQAWVDRYGIAHVVKFTNHLSPASIEAGLQAVRIEDTVFDCSSLTTLQFQEIADKFCWLLFNMQARMQSEQRRQMFVIFEEAHIVLPEGSMKSKRLQNVVRLMTVGRNFKIRMGVITQFASMIDKMAIRCQGQRYFGWTAEYNDVKRVASMIGEEAAETLKYYKTGDFWYYAPALQIEEKISVEPYKAKV